MADSEGDKLPHAVLFACTLNAVRSPMAEGLMRHLFGHRAHVESVGVRACPLDPMAAAAMNEIGIDITGHEPRSFADLRGATFDLVVTLSPEAHHTALELTREGGVAVEYWPTVDPTAYEGSREQVLAAYRGVRDELTKRITARFGEARVGEV